MRRFVYQVLLLSMLVPNVISSIEPWNTGIESKEDVKSSPCIKYKIPLSGVLNSDGSIKPELMDGSLPAPRPGVTPKGAPIRDTEEGRSPIPDEYYVSDTIVRSKSLRNLTRSADYDSRVGGGKGICGEPAGRVMDRVFGRPGGCVVYGGERHSPIPTDDYVKDLCEFLRSESAPLVLGTLLKDKSGSTPEWIHIDELKQLKIQSTRNSVLEYVTGREHWKNSDSFHQIDLVVSDVKRSEGGPYCLYKICDSRVPDDLYEECNKKDLQEGTAGLFYMGNQLYKVCNPYATGVSCEKCNTKVPEEGTAEFWYTGKQAEIHGKTYNIYTIFGTKVLNVAGDLITPYTREPDIYEKSSSNKNDKKGDIVNNDCVTI